MTISGRLANNLLALALSLMKAHDKEMGRTHLCSAA